MPVAPTGALSAPVGATFRGTTLHLASFAR